LEYPYYDFCKHHFPELEPQGGDVTDTKSDTLKDITVNTGMLLILVGSIATRVDLAYFFLALAILAIQTFEFSSIQAKKLVMAEIILSATIAIGSVTQLVTFSGSKSQQAVLAALLLGGLLIIIEAVRKYADL
jgi:hypothetical protein